MSLIPPVNVTSEDVFWQLVVNVETAPASLGGRELEDYGQRRLVRETAFERTVR
jgi:hypothetical protein